MRRGIKQLAASAALACAATPSVAFDHFSQPQSGVKFYLSVPLDARNAKEQALSAGFAIQGRRDYEAIRIDSGMINRFIGGGIETKWIIAGVVAAGAVAAVATKDKSTAAAQEQQQAAQLEQQRQQQTGGGGSEPCPVTPTCP